MKVILIFIDIIMALAFMPVTQAQTITHLGLGTTSYSDPVCKAYVTHMEVVIKYGSKGQAMLAYMSGMGSTPESQQSEDFDKLALSRSQSGKYTPQQLENWAYQYCESGKAAQAAQAQKQQESSGIFPLSKWTCSRNNMVWLWVYEVALNADLGTEPDASVYYPTNAWSSIYSATPSQTAADQVVNYIEATGLSVGSSFYKDRRLAEENNPNVPEKLKKQIAVKIVADLVQRTTAAVSESCPDMLKGVQAQDAAYRAQVKADANGTGI